MASKKSPPPEKLLSVRDLGYLLQVSPKDLLAIPSLQRRLKLPLRELDAWLQEMRASARQLAARQARKEAAA